MRLLVMEARRALHRRIVWGLLGLAIFLIALTAVLVFVDSADLDLVRVRAEGAHHAAVMADWWLPGTAEGLLAITAIFLVVGGLIGGATVAGGEWRAGTVGTVLTWEPRRARLHAARLGACAGLAWLLAFGLQALFLAALLPAVLAHGSAADTDGAWAVALVAAMARISVLAALAAILGGALAVIGRATAGALAVGGVWLAVGESLVRAWRPGFGRFLLTGNAGVLLGWAPLNTEPWTRPPALALATLLTYAVAVGAVAGVLFYRRDVGAA
jgi:hypothetical protein